MNKVIATAPDGRRVQVMEPDVPEYRAMGYQFDGDGVPEPAPAPRTLKSTTRKSQPKNPPVDLP